MSGTRRQCLAVGFLDRVILNLLGHGLHSTFAGYVEREVHLNHSGIAVLSDRHQQAVRRGQARRRGKHLVMPLDVQHLPGWGVVAQAAQNRLGDNARET